MRRFATNRNEIYSSTHESVRLEVHGERKFEAQKLDRLKKLLQMKVEAAMGEPKSGSDRLSLCGRTPFSS
jgi:hypothetical protein